MSTFDYSGMVATASRLIAKFGAAITVNRTTGETIDPVTNVATGGTPVTLSANGIIRRYPAKMIDGTRIEQGDKEVVLDPSVTMLIDDTLTIDGDDWNIMDINTVAPDNTPLVYFIQVRK